MIVVDDYNYMFRLFMKIPEFGACGNRSRSGVLQKTMPTAFFFVGHELSQTLATFQNDNREIYEGKDIN